MSKLQKIYNKINLSKQLKKAINEGKLNEFLNDFYDPRIINILDKEKIVIDDIKNLNYFLLYRQEFVDYLLKYHIENIKFIPEEMIREEHLKQYANYLRNNSFDFYALPNNNKVLLNEEIFNVLLSKINTADDLSFFLNFIENDNYLLKAIDVGEEKKLFNGVIYKVFYKNPTIFKRMLKIYGALLIVESSYYVPNLDEFLPIIIEALASGELVISSNRYNRNIANILTKPEVYKAVLDSPKYKRMAYLFTKIDIDINLLSDEQLTKFSEILYYNYQAGNYIKNVKYIQSPLLLQKMIELNCYSIIDSFKSEAYTDDSIKFLCDNLKNKDDRFISNVLEYKIVVEYLNHPYFIKTLEEMLATKKDFECMVSIIKMYLKLAIINEDTPATLKAISLMKKNNIGMFLELRKSSFLLKNLVSMKAIDYINQMDGEVFSKDILNSLYHQLCLADFIDLNYVFNNLVLVFENVDIDDYLTFFNYLVYFTYPDLTMLIIKKYNESNLNDDHLNELRDFLIFKITDQFSQKINDQNLVNTLIEKILNGQRSPINMKYINNYKTLYFVTNITDISSTNDLENIEVLPLTVLEKVNKKHIREIISLMKNLDVSNGEKILLAYNIYLSIGFARARDLLSPNLNKSYGPVNGQELKTIFLNIKPVDIMFKQEGNGYVPVLNEEWIKLLFGESYKVKNTPIRNYLNDFKDKKEEIDNLKKKVDDDLSLTVEEKNLKKEELGKQFGKYFDDLSTFISLCSTSFNEWDIISEEFFKLANRVKLKTKLNIAKVNEILKLIKNKRNLPDLDIQDDLLINSDVLDYAGYDNQYTYDAEKAPSRAISISRKMNNYQKKFPNVTVSKDNLTLEVYNPQDRRLLSAGYRSKCCFRPNGNADNLGNDNSLLYYCATNEYGGGIEIRNQDGKTIMFSPILRNGNVLMIHSIETYGLDKNANLVYELLVKYANEVILESEKNNDDIEFVAITNLHNLDVSYTIGSIPVEYKFRVYDPDSKFNDMYHNLNCEQFLLAKKMGKSLKDIRYDEKVKSYEYPKIKTYLSISVTSEEQQMIIKLDKEKQEIIKLANERYEALKNNDELLAYDLLARINEKKSIYLKGYQEILKARKGRDIYLEYQKALSSIKRINEELNIENINNLRDITMGSDWYIAFDESGKMYFNALESGQEQLKEELNKIREVRSEDTMKL